MADPVSTIKILTTILTVGVSGESVAGSLVRRLKEKKDREERRPGPTTDVIDPGFIPSLPVPTRPTAPPRDVPAQPQVALLPPFLPGIGGRVLVTGEAATIFGAIGRVLGPVAVIGTGTIIGARGLIKIARVFGKELQRQAAKTAKEEAEKIIERMNRQERLDREMRKKRNEARARLGLPPLGTGPNVESPGQTGAKVRGIKGPPRPGPRVAVKPVGPPKKTPGVSAPRLPAPTPTPRAATTATKALLPRVLLGGGALALLTNLVVGKKKKKRSDLTLPKTPGVPSPDPLTTANISPGIFAFVQPGGSRAEDGCQNVLRRRRRKGKCREGFFEERPGSTRFTTWRTVDCVTRKTIPKTRKV